MKGNLAVEFHSFLEIDDLVVVWISQLASRINQIPGSHMLRICQALLLTFSLAAQETNSFIDLRGRPKPGEPLVAEIDAANAVFHVGESQVVLENFKFRKPWIGSWQIVFNVRNRTEHHLESVILAFVFVSKAGEELSDPRKLLTLRVPDLPETDARTLPFTINIPAELRPEKSKDAETIRAYLVSFKARANAEDLAAAAKAKERKEREERLAAIKAEQERVESEARAQREKEEFDRADALAADKKASALKAAEAARRKQQEAAARKAPVSQGLVTPAASSAPNVGDPSADYTPSSTTVGFMALGAFIFGGFLFGYSRSGAAKARRLARATLAPMVDLDLSIRRFQKQAKEAMELAARNYVVGIQTMRLKGIPVEEIKSIAPGVRLQALRSIGINSLADLQGRSPSALIQIRGIGQDSANRISAAAAILIANSNKRSIPVSWPGSEGGAERPMLEAICHFGRSQNWFADPNGQFPRLIREFKELEGQIRKKSSRLRWVLSLVNLADTTIALELAESLGNKLGEGSEAGQLVREFQKCLLEATTEFRVGLQWPHLVKDMALRPDTYKGQLTSLLGAWQAGAMEATRPTSSGSAVLARPSITRSEGAYSISVRASFQEESTPLVDLSRLWIPQGKEVTICGFRIQGGMIYTGSIANTQAGRREASLIDPKLPVQVGAADCCIRKMGYWPSYESIEPDARASYLEWLSTGRSNPNADIGYVFLFFYGLERRVLADAPKDPVALAELAAIEVEIIRLLGLYSSGSFIGYASSLLDYIRAKRGVWEGGTDFEFSSNRGPFVLKAAIGRLSLEGRSLSSDLAYSWYRSDPTTRHRTPMERCPEILKVAFTTEFTRLFPQGLKLPQNKTKLKVSHRPASGSLNGGVYNVDLDLPDVSVLSSPVQKLQGVGEAAVASLEQYSRFIGKNPSQEKTLDALLLLPQNFWPEEFLSPLLAMLLEIETSGRPRLMNLLDLQLLLPEGMDFTKGSYNSLCRGLESLGLGIEPDIQFGGGVPEIKDPIVLFEARDRGKSTAPSPGFNGAAILLQLASAVAGADGDFGEAEARLLLGHINQGLSLPGDEIRRLQARLELFRRNPPPLTGLKKKIDTIGMASRKAIGEFLVQVVHADGVVAAEEVRSLEKVFKLLSLDTSTLYSQIHGASTEPAQVRVPGEEASSFRIPPPPKPVDLQGPLKLDMAKVAALKADSAKVSELLGAIFSEAPPSEQPHPDSIEVGHKTASLEARGPLPALDPDHHDLLQTLLQRPQWSRAELEEICSDRGLMVDGAIERINEAAFEQYDQPIIEGDDPLDVNRELTLEIA